MSWTTQDGGYYSRPFDCHERMFQLLCSVGAENDRQHWLIMINAKIDFPKYNTRDEIMAKLQLAWQALRFRHPDIALEIHENEKRYYPILDRQALETWCRETCHLEATGSADEFFSRHRRPGASATLHWFPATSQIALIASHIRWDGRGAILMLQEFLSILDNPVIPAVLDGAESKNLVPALGEVIGMPETPHPEWEKRAAEIFQPVIEAQPSIGSLPSGDPRAAPGDTQRAQLVIPPELSTALREAGRKQGLTVSATIQTAAIMALSTGSESQAENFASWTPFDLRKYCPKPFDGPVHAPSLRMCGLPIIVKSRGSWSEISQAISQVNQKSWDMKENDMMFIRECLVRTAVGMFEAMLSMPDLPPSTVPDISSLGILDNYIQREHGSFKVDDVSIMVHMVPPMICLHNWSWRGALHLSASYNVSYYTADDVQKYLHAVKDIMVKNLLGTDTA